MITRHHSFTAGDTIKVELCVACVADPVSELKLLLFSNQPITLPDGAVPTKMEQVSRWGAYSFKSPLCSKL